MTAKRILFTEADGTLSIVCPADDAPEPAEGQTQAEAEAAHLAAIVAGAVPEGAAWEVIDAAEVETRERTFRKAWRQAGKAITTDLPAARLIAHDKRRDARAREFAPLDVEATIPAKASEAEAKRQAIRDRYAVVQTNIDAAADEAALLAIVQALPA